MIVNRTKEFVLLAISTLAAATIALGLIRWLAPGLLGINQDLMLVRSSDEAVPFFETAVAGAPQSDEEMLIPDPLVKQRGAPLMRDMAAVGPGDLLGFRNRGVPNAADVLVVGDSQTYGNNAIIYENWPHQLLRGLPRSMSVYSMAVGGWGAIQYLYASRKGLALSPQVVAVAFYSGNDALESFMMAYGSAQWAELVPDHALDKSDAPSYPYPPPQQDFWPVTFKNGQSMVFTPALRHQSNRRHPAIDAGYRIMADVAGRISKLALGAGAQPVFTIIPTKEYVYEERIESEGIEPPASYRRLIEDEGARLTWLVEQIEALPDTHYVDVIRPLREAAKVENRLYPSDWNGHPYRRGYTVIAEQMGHAIAGLLTDQVAGVVTVSPDNASLGVLYYVDGDRFWMIEDVDLLRNHSNKVSIPIVSGQRLTHRRYMGTLTAEVLASLRAQAQR